jgi:hypothetical protein
MGSFIYKVLPKYREENLFMVSLVTLITTVLTPEILSVVFQDILTIIGALMFGYAYLLMIYYALSKKEVRLIWIVPLVMLALVTELFLSLFSSYYWLFLYIFKLAKSPVNMILLGLTIVSMVHSLLLILVFLSRNLDYTRLFIPGNADRRIIAVCTAVIIVGFVWNLFYGVPTVVFAPFLLGICSIIIGLKEWIV